MEPCAGVDGIRGKATLGRGNQKIATAAAAEAARVALNVNMIGDDPVSERRLAFLSTDCE